MRALAIVAVGLAGACVVPAEDVDSIVEEVCCGATCCNVAGATGATSGTSCFTTGEASVDDPCMVCDPSMSQSSLVFSPTCDAGAPAEDAGGEDAGMPMMDSGPMDDAGAPEEDAGGDPDAGGDDAGADEDAGGGTDAGDGDGGGGGCSVASGSQNVWLLAIGIVALVLRRRRLL